jgi:hypothetical protein
LTPSDGYGAYVLVIDRDREIIYGGSVGSVRGGFDQTVEALEGGELEIARRRGF